jgi:hypothetical protein
MNRRIRAFAALLLLAAVIAGCDEDEPPTVIPATTQQPAGEIPPLSRQPEPPPPATPAQLGPRPAPIAPWNGSSMMLYDFESGTAVDYGFGTPGVFSPDDAHVLWARTGPFQLEGAVTVMNLASAVETPIGNGTALGWVDNERAAFYLQGAGATTEVVNIVTGERETTGPVQIGEPFDQQTTPEGYVLHQEFTSENPFPRSRFTLVDPARGDLELLSFEAWKAAPAGRGYLVAASEPLSSGPPNEFGVAPQTTNIYLIQVASGIAAFIATSPAYGPNWPLVADETFIAWTEDYCAPAPGRTRLFDRRTSEIRELDATLWLDSFTPDGLLAAGAFGADELIDPETLQYTAVLPSSEAQWSSDYRYASVGQVGGHGGLCP